MEAGNWRVTARWAEDGPGWGGVWGTPLGGTPECVHPTLGDVSSPGDWDEARKPRWSFQHLSLACDGERISSNSSGPEGQVSL